MPIFEIGFSVEISGVLGIIIIKKSGFSVLVNRFVKISHRAANRAEQSDQAVAVDCVAVIFMMRRKAMKRILGRKTNFDAE